MGGKKLDRKELVGIILSLGAAVKKPKGVAHWRYPQRPNLLQGIAAVKAGPYMRQFAGYRFL